VVEEWPKSAFSLKGWKENLPKYVPNRNFSFPIVAGQSFTYMVYANIMKLTAKMSGMSQENHGSGAGE
jgi:hypothetical protein